MKSKELIDALIARTVKNRQEAIELKHLARKALNQRPAPGSWNALECIEHLNRYGDFYIPEIKKRLDASTYKKSEAFKPGLLGNYFSKSMLPKGNKMKTFKPMNPIDCALETGVIDTFVRQQNDLLELLEAARLTDLTKVKTAISISKWIKLRLGDTLRVVIYHNHRHLIQARRATGHFKGDF